MDHGTVRTAQNFNHPLKIYSLDTTSKTASSKSSPSLLSSLKLTGSPALILDCIKRGEDDIDVSRGTLPARKGRSIIARIYESLGGKARGTLDFSGLDVKRACKCNLLEDDGDELAIMFGEARGVIGIELKPFEVATYRLQI